MAQPYAYCDDNAGAPLRPAALEAMTRALAQGANASSIHRRGREAQAALEQAREQIAAAICALPANVIFTSGATEGVHLALEGAEAAGARAVVMSAVEHDALAQHAPLVFADVRIAPVTADGLVDPAALDVLLAAAPRPSLVAVMAANNETGAIQPLAAVAAVARRHGALLLVDAAQAPGRMRVDLQAWDASYLVLSSHKVGGPPGAGVLALAPGAPFAAVRAGGGQERGRRPGTQNVPACVGFAAALAEAHAAERAEVPRLAALRDSFEQGLRAAAPDVTIFSQSAPRLANTSLFAVPGLRAETALIGLDLAGFAVSSGAACSSGKVRKSRVLAAMGASDALASGAIRASFGWASTKPQAQALLAAVVAEANRARARQAALAEIEP